jgi:hypothetical protein
LLQDAQGHQAALSRYSFTRGVTFWPNRRSSACGLVGPFSRSGASFTPAAAQAAASISSRVAQLGAASANEAGAAMATTAQRRTE